MEMMDMIMNGCNIVAVEDVITAVEDVVMEKRWLCVQCKVTLVCAMEQVIC